MADDNWTRTEHLLALVADLQALSMWDGKQAHKPKPVERPGINEKKRTGDASALTPAQVRSVLDRRKPIPQEV